MNQTDEQLARGLAAGSIEAWHALYDAYAEAVWYSVARRVGPHTAVVADIVQETFLLAARSARSFDPARGTALHWLRGIARTQTALHFRRRQTRPEATGDDFRTLARDADADPLAAAETAAAVRQVLGALPDDYEILLVGKYLDGLTLDQLAQAAGSTVEATSSKLARARRAFREAYDALTGDEHIAPQGGDHLAPPGGDHRAPQGGDQLRTQRVEA